MIALSGHVETALGREFLAFLGNEAHVARTDTLRDRDHLVGHGHLEIHMRAHDLVDFIEIVILDMPAILAQVHGNAIGAGVLGNVRSLGRTRVARAARLPQRRDVIDIHAEIDRIIIAHSLTLRVASGCRHSNATAMQVDVVPCDSSVPCRPRWKLHHGHVAAGPRHCSVSASSKRRCSRMAMQHRARGKHHRSQYLRLTFTGPLLGAILIRSTSAAMSPLPIEAS